MEQRRYEYDIEDIGWFIWATQVALRENIHSIS